MTGFTVSALVGMLCIALGISHRKGNIESLHSYHRKRVSQEDRIPFGKKVGLGMILIGISIILFSALAAFAVYFETPALTVIGSVIMILGLAAGSWIAFAAMIKYNKGIF